MRDLHAVFEHFSLAVGVGVRMLCKSGETRYASPSLREFEKVFGSLLDALDCAQAEQMALLYGCNQSRRFGGRYIFFGPSGLTYCATPLLDERGAFIAGAIAGPFLMADHDEYLDVDLYNRLKADPQAIERFRDVVFALPHKPPPVARAINEQLFLCAAHARGAAPDDPPLQMDALAYSYPLDKEDELLDAVSRGEIGEAGALLNDLLGQVLFHSGNDFETLRSRVFELTVLLSRAALKGGADIDAIFGLNFAYLREIDALSTVEDIVKWLRGVTQRFGQHVLAPAEARYTGAASKAVAYIRANYMHKITLRDMADHVFLSPTYFSKLFKDETGCTPSSFLTDVRIEAGKRLLRDPTLGMVDIPEMIGFDNQSYFTRVFKKSQGLTPSQYRRKNR